MAQQIYITYSSETEEIANTIGNHTFFNAKVEIPDSGVDATTLSRLALMCQTEFFYVINSSVGIHFPDFNFSFKPMPWDAEYVHIWGNNNSVRLYNKSLVLDAPEKFSDDMLYLGKVALKVSDLDIYENIPLDIIFLSYDEKYADKNYKSLASKFPRAKRVTGVAGIAEAHLAAAREASTDMFYVVDADAYILSDFNFDYMPEIYDRKAVYVWSSINPVNDLRYGYGGIKLFNTNMLLNYTGNSVDFATSISTRFKLMPGISNITVFNTDPFSSWRSGFRECVKLASKIISNQDTDTANRLNVWCTQGADQPFGEFVINGARAGAAYGKAHMNQPELLGLINDFEWLKSQFDLAMRS